MEYPASHRRLAQPSIRFRVFRAPERLFQSLRSLIRPASNRSCSDYCLAKRGTNPFAGSLRFSPLGPIGTPISQSVHENERSCAARIRPGIPALPSKAFRHTSSCSYGSWGSSSSVLTMASIACSLPSRFRAENTFVPLARGWENFIDGLSLRLSLSKRQRECGSTCSLRRVGGSTRIAWGPPPHENSILHFGPAQPAGCHGGCRFSRDGTGSNQSWFLQLV